MQNSSDSLEFTSKPSLRSWISGLFGLILIGLNVLMIVFISLIILNTEQRSKFLNWALFAIVMEFILYSITKRTIAYSPKTLIVTDKSMVFYSIFRRIEGLTLDEILHIEFVRRGGLLNIFRIYKTKLRIFTSDETLNISVGLWKKRDEFKEFILKLMESREIDNIYVKNFHYKSSMIDILRRVSHTSQGKFALFTLIVFTSLAILGALAMMMDPPSALDTHTLFLRNPDFPNYSLPNFDYDSAVLAAPSWDFLFGTDFAGRDVFSRLIFGTSVTYYIAIVGASLSVMFMILFGLSSAIYGGAWDAFVTRFSDVLLTFPWVVWLIIISTFSGPLRVSIPGGFYFAVYLGMSFVTWPFGARLLRSEIVETLQSEYIAAITLVGASKSWIIRRHVLSKIVPTILLLFAYQMSDIIIGISLLGYIGYPSESAIVWGSELSIAIQAPNLGSEWWTVIFPAMFIVILVLALSLFSDAIRDIYEAKFRGGASGTLFSSVGGRNK